METVEKIRGADPELEEYLAGLCTEGGLENPDAVSLEIQTWVTNSLGGLREGIGSETTLDGPWIETELPVRYDPVQGTISAEGKTEELRGRLDRMASLFRALTDNLILTYPPESEGRGGPTPAASFMHEPVNLDETELQCALAEDRFLGFRVFDFDAVYDFGHADPHSFPVLTRRQKVGGKLAEQFTVDLEIQGLSVRVIPSVSVSPLILFRDDPEDLAGRGFYFVSVGLALRPPRLEDATDHEIDLYAELSDLTTWPAEGLKRLWEALLRTKFASATVVFGITTSEPEATLRDVTQAFLQQLATAKEKFEELTEQLQTAHARVESCERDLKKVLGDTTKQQLLKERDELVRQNNQLAQSLTLVQKAVGYFEEFSPEECPVCDTGVSPADVLSRLQDRVGSDLHAAELNDALKRRVCPDLS